MQVLDADPAHKHAVATMGSNSYSYDANGNMVSRAGDTLSYDAENRLTQVTSGGVTTTYTYDGDGARVKKDVAGSSTFYVGNYFEATNSGAVTKYYYFGAQRVAMNQGGAVTYLHTDHLGSTNATSGANTTSGVVYFPFGSARAGNLPTDFGFTGQRFDASDGLMYYNARYYDAALGRFISADTLVPGAGNPQTLNRYAYVRNNPVRYTDPTGHRACGDIGEEDCDKPGDIGEPGTGESLLTSIECRSSAAKCNEYDPTDQQPRPPTNNTKASQSYIHDIYGNPVNATLAPLGAYIQGDLLLVGGRGSAHLVFDAQGNWAVVGTLEGGPAVGIGVSGGYSGYFTNATNIDDQLSKTLITQTGGSVDLGGAAGADIIVAEKMTGFAWSLGAGGAELDGIPVPIEVHAFLGPSDLSRVIFRGRYDFWNR